MKESKSKETAHRLPVSHASSPAHATGNIVQKKSMGKCPVSIKVEDDKFQDVTFAEPYNSMPDPFLSLLKDLTATQDSDIAREILVTGTLAMPNNKCNRDKINVMLQALANSAPADAVEARLCMQTTVLYAQGMQYIANAEQVEHLPLKEFYMKNAIKLLRLHNETIEAVNRHHRGGEQRVMVQHVYVNEGSQAIVGTVLNGGGGQQKNDEVIP